MIRPNASIVVLTLGMAAVGCSLVAEFDRSKIPEQGDGGGAPRDDGGGACSMDAGCSGTCDNGVLEPGETCDPPGSCPTSCEDGTACTAEMLTGSAEACNAACDSQEITDCRNNDGCCPAGCNFMRDNDCSADCGNGMAEPGETCDPTTLCPTDCSDGNACTVDTTTGSVENCNVACSYELITACEDDDGCCPAGCNNNTDKDCSTDCGNEAVEPGETCDPASMCPTSCDDGNACTINTLTGSPENCNVACSAQVITQCQSDDGCCPTGCNANNDSDCTTTCDNDVIEPGETCDPSTMCPTLATCNDGTACTIDRFTGNAANCTAACTYQTITQCANGDGCCPPGCNNNNDRDCPASCGNRVVEPGETCDPAASCPTAAMCNDGSACTIDMLTGSATACTAACSHQTITQCQSGDGCCPPGCNNNNDRDCTATCNNNVVEAGETCDPRSSCPTACNDGAVCTVDRLTGSAANCTATCTYPTITQCQNGDGCCPAGCNNNTDRDCTVSCGNGVIEAGETCDPRSSCRSSCEDGNACTIDSLTGSASNCNVACTYQTITQCRNGDRCCPPGCNNNNDNDCSVRCGNGSVETGETCDPASSCPTTCNDGLACTQDRLTGSAANCTAACANPPITACQNNDGCCPGGCTIANDNNCSATCGDGVLTAPETCDPGIATGTGRCPTTCNDGLACTTDVLAGTAMSCSATCSHVAISACANGDGCCAPGCNIATDSDCSASCGDGVLTAPEICDPMITSGAGVCITNCNDNVACTADSSSGSAATCNIMCTNTPITSCAPGDQCCPSNCNIGNDSDCMIRCGDGVVSTGESCDTGISAGVGRCPAAAADCNDMMVCTTDAVMGSGCSATCVNTPITACSAGVSDGCCPSSCAFATDVDCPPPADDAGTGDGGP